MKCNVCGCENNNTNTTCIKCGNNLTNQVNNMNSTTQHKIKIIPLILSIILPGISYLYLRQYLRALVFLLVFPLIFFSFAFILSFYTMMIPSRVALAAYMIIIIIALVYIYQIIDCYKIASSNKK